jgi:hypothetical protein
MINKQPYTFDITIDDKFSEYKYQFKLNEDVSIYDIALAIADSFNVEIPNGVHINEKE